MDHTDFAKSCWNVFLLFAIPWGGGIPAGVVLAQSRGLAWPVMSVLYLLSDVALAFVFEPLALLLVAGAKRSAFLHRFKETYKKTLNKSSELGVPLGPFGYVLLAFGADPMTARTAAMAAGHGFVSGWAFAITGDMFYFWLLMASTLWLQGILGNGTATTVVITLAMLLGPPLFRRVRDKWRARKSGCPE